ncbi:MAG: hypothetical protein M4579_006929 [Chaenotheca gracillima]|nr:MAG: hypothetical protein M4579_006929 [Chaenotheca gracillima]
MAEASAPESAPSADVAPGTSGINLRAQLTHLIAQATREYSSKNYSAASDLYAQASELQAELNGETSTDNAELLYLYGRSLYQVGVSQSDVLGGNASSEKEEQPAKERKKKREDGGKGEALASEEQRVAEEVVTKVVEDKGALPPAQESSTGPSDTNKPLFQFTGDENWDDSEDDEEGDGDEGDAGAAEGEEEEDDLTAAWNVLDLAHVLFERKLQEASEEEGKGKGKGDSPEVKHIKERLADTHDLLAEISLEGERFPAAVTDFRASLLLKHELYPIESSLIAEGHLKLSLALEFASMTVAREEGAEAEPGAEAQVDEAGRSEAAKEMEAAISSCRLRVQKEETSLSAAESASQIDEEKANTTRKSIADVKEMIADMEQRLTDLRAPPVSVEAALSGPAGAPDGSNPMSGILGSILGESPSEQKTRLEGAMKDAKDLTGLVKRKKPTPASVGAANANGGTSSNGVNGTGKRKVEFAEEVEEVGTGKKARVEDAED